MTAHVGEKGFRVKLSRTGGRREGGGGAKKRDTKRGKRRHRAGEELWLRKIHSRVRGVQRKRVRDIEGESASSSDGNSSSSVFPTIKRARWCIEAKASDVFLKEL